MFVANLLTIATFVAAAHGLGVKNIILTNDDGWAVAQIRAQNTALKRAGFNVSFHKYDIMYDAVFIQFVSRLYCLLQLRMSLEQAPALHRLQFSPSLANSTLALWDLLRKGSILATVRSPLFASI